MDQAELRVDLIEITVKGTFKTDHVFNTGSGVLGALTIRGSKGEGSFIGTDDVLLDFKRPSIWKNQYELQEESVTIGKAHPPNKLKRAFEIDLEGQVYHLAPGGSKMRSWTLTNKQNLEICEVLPRGGLKRGAYIKIGAEISLKLLVFSYFLVAKRWQEESAAAAG